MGMDAKKDIVLRAKKHVCIARVESRVVTRIGRLVGKRDRVVSSRFTNLVGYVSRHVDCNLEYRLVGYSYRKLSIGLTPSVHRTYRPGVKESLGESAQSIMSLQWAPNRVITVFGLAATCSLPSLAMRPRLPIRSLSFVRSYATRLPERPPYRAPDPLKDNPHATYESLSEDLTFIRRPPPTAESPESYTVSPASPLLKPQASTPTGELPPVLFPRKSPEPPRMSKELIEKMRELRRKDPAAWTAGKLAKEFGCTQSFVRMWASLKKPERRKALARRDVEHDANREKWGDKRLMQKDIRLKRKEFW